MSAAFRTAFVHDLQAGSAVARAASQLGSGPVDLLLAFVGGKHRRQVLAGVGHAIPAEAPDAVVRALLELLRA